MNETPKLSSNVQLALASLWAIIVGTAVGIYVIGSGISAEVLPEAAGPLFALILALAFFSVSLLWVGNRFGYIGALITGILHIVNMGVVLGDVATGITDLAWLIFAIPGIVFGLILLASAYAAWRE
ncbi:MAG: hypothetical protein V3U52_01415 [Thermoplasmata archaeon]